jgi:methylenetetrahydrofolate--tRNA-(uracil-5-)-methyltransferase
MRIAIVGAGLAGCEAAWTLAERYNVGVDLFEMKGTHPNPAQSEPHHFAELVCSNSLKSTSRLNPCSLLKDEMAALGSLLIPTARLHAVPAGETLAVDRVQFSGAITQQIREHRNITIREEEVTALRTLLAAVEYAAIIIATGPLTADPLATDLMAETGAQNGFFYDAIAPILDGSTVDMEVAFWQNRTTRTAAFEGRGDEAEGEGDYLNLPLEKQDYFTFLEALLAAEKTPFRAFEKPQFFNGCQPIEALAESGPRTLAFGPMKPRGITNPRTGRWPYAVVQLRRESLGDSAFNMVGFQTRLTWPEQKRVFRLLPGLQNAEFFRMGSMHRNTYFVAPQILSENLSLRAHPNVWLAGQIMGVEGYVESAAMGVLIGHIVGELKVHGRSLALPPPTTALGALVRFLLHSAPKHFTPMNMHWGLFDELSPENLAAYAPPEALKQRKLDKSTRRSVLSQRTVAAFREWVSASARLETL